MLVRLSSTPCRVRSTSCPRTLSVHVVWAGPDKKALVATSSWILRVVSSFRCQEQISQVTAAADEEKKTVTLEVSDTGLEALLQSS